MLPTVYTTSESSVGRHNGFAVGTSVCYLNWYMKISLLGTGGTTVDVRGGIAVGGSLDVKLNRINTLFIHIIRL